MSLFCLIFAIFLTQALTEISNIPSSSFLAFATGGDGMYMHVYLKEYYLQVLVSQQEIETFLPYTDRPTDHQMDISV